jgi:hypothetical protein
MGRECGVAPSPKSGSPNGHGEWKPAAQAALRGTAPSRFPMVGPAFTEHDLRVRACGCEKGN